MISLFGVFAILLVCWLISKDRKSINWYTIFSGLILQIALAFFILKSSLGQIIFQKISDCIIALIHLSGKGGEFAFGSLYNSPTNEFIFAFKVTPAIIFISALVSVLYFMGIMHPFLKATSWLLHKLMGVSGAEALANIASAFVGQVESALPLRPYFSRLSQAQFFSIMVGGMSTMSAALLATYASLGIPSQYLLTANLMGIPGGLIIAKLIWPSVQGENSELLPEPEKTEAANLMDAAVHGAQEGLKISLGVISMVIAFVSLVALVDMLLANFNITLSDIFGILLFPVAILMGAPLEDSHLIASLLGQKLALNEFVAYLDLSNKMKLCDLSPNSLLIASFSLCGFANFGSVAIQLGAFSQMLPERRSEFAQMGILAMIGGALSSCLSACLAHLFL